MVIPSPLLSRPRRCRDLLLVLVVLLSGCEKNEVAAYRVPKEADVSLTVAATTTPAEIPTVAADAPNPSVGSMAGMPVAAAGSGLSWTAPAGWQPKPLGAMRKGSYIIAGDAGATADLSITAFPGTVGGEFANVNRWRGQLALPPIAESDLGAAVTHLSANGLTFTLVDLVGIGAANPQRMLGAMAPFEGAMWFFKLSGSDALVAATKPAFLDFIRTVRSAAPAAP